MSKPIRVERAPREAATDERGWRDGVVAAQYNAPSAAAEYAGAHRRTDGTARFFDERIRLVLRILTLTSGGRLLDAGCGPGMLIRALLDTRGGDFDVIALDRSPAMIDECVRRAGDGVASAVVGRIEEMPFPDGSFDVVLAMGVLEYVDAPRALAEIARVVRPGGLALVSMLNPASPYRFLQWRVYWPMLRVLGRVEARMGVPQGRRHDPGESGIKAYHERALRDVLHDAGLASTRSTFFAPALPVPPLDRLARRRPESRFLGTGYLVTARKDA